MPSHKKRHTENYLFYIIAVGVQIEDRFFSIEIKRNEDYDDYDDDEKENEKALTKYTRIIKIKRNHLPK